MSLFHAKLGLVGGGMSAGRERERERERLRDRERDGGKRKSQIRLILGGISNTFMLQIV